MDSTDILTTGPPLEFPSSSLGITVALLIPSKGLAEPTRHSMIMGAPSLEACRGAEPGERRGGGVRGEDLELCTKPFAK